MRGENAGNEREREREREERKKERKKEERRKTSLSLSSRFKVSNVKFFALFSLTLNHIFILASS